MKKKVLAIAAIGLIVASCGSSKGDFDEAATTLCECMAKSTDVDSGPLDMSVNISLCSLTMSVDLKDPQMAESVAEKCPDIKDAFDDYVKDM
ncbi:MAG: hypothetical protein ACI837_001303 [Crocinitomicaceae bacterium]|jgi:hypothetical protein